MSIEFSIFINFVQNQQRHKKLLPEGVHPRVRPDSLFNRNVHDASVLISLPHYGHSKVSIDLIQIHKLFQELTWT